MLLISLPSINFKKKIFHIFSPAKVCLLQHVCCLENISSVIFRFNCSVAEFRNNIDISVFCTKKCSAVKEEN